MGILAKTMESVSMFQMPQREMTNMNVDAPTHFLEDIVNDGEISKAHTLFILSNVGKICERSIINRAECKQAADLLPKGAFVTGQGDGHDMPNGCIYDKSTPNRHYVFWNQAGAAISADHNVREICKEVGDPFEGLDCINDYRKIRGPDSCQVKPHSKPWMVNLVLSCKNLCDLPTVPKICQKDGVCQQDKLFHHCGGTLLEQNIVLTAAHCICLPLPSKKLICDVWKLSKAILGDHDGLNYGDGFKTENEKFIGIQHGEPHGKYVENNGDITQGYDIAILILKQKVSFNERIKKAYLPSPNSACPSDKILITSGWGNPVGYFGHSLLHRFEHRFLWAVRQRCIDDLDRCLDLIPGGVPSRNPDAIICAVGSDNGINAPHHGDSGGPLSYTVGGKTTVIGVVSGGSWWDGATMYSRVSKPDILSWINAMKTKYEQ